MNSKNMSIIALVCGIVGIAGAFIPVDFLTYIAPLAAIAGIVFGALALKRFKNGDDSGSKGMAIAGLVMGIVSTAVSVLVAACAVCAICVAAGIIGAAGGLGAYSSLFLFLL